MKYIEVKDYETLSKKTADIIAAQVLVKPNCVLGLATGSSPEGAYAELVKMNKEGVVDFSEVTTFNLDEYCGLDGSNDQSYRYFMDNHLFNHININKDETNVPSGKASDFAKEGEEYDKKVEKRGGIDLQLLGIGPDGHIGFNEPCDEFVGPTHQVSLDPSTIEANARFFDSVDDVPTTAITMGMKTIMQAKKILMIASGEKKYDILQKAMFGPITPMVPASILQLHPDVTVIYSK